MLHRQTVWLKLTLCCNSHWTLTSVALISAVDDLHDRLAYWRRQPWLTVDTEFVREDTYHAQLSLIQIGTADGADCIDVLAFADLQALAQLLLDPRIVKVLHSPSQDLEIFVQRLGGCPAPLFDSQLAATLLGIADQPGYASLIHGLLGVSIDKRLARTPWLRRPLSAEELAYAEADVSYLAEVYPLLEQRLQAAGRLDWLREDCARICDAERYRPRPELEWQRIKAIVRLDHAAQYVLAELAAWREREAEARDRPRKWIVSDELLCTLAERQPGSELQLQGLQLLSEKQLGRYTPAVLDAVAQGLERAARHAEPLVQDLRDDPTFKARLQRLQQQVKAVAEANGLPPGLLAPRADLEAIVRLGPAAGVPCLDGWRRALLGQHWLDSQ